MGIGNNQLIYIMFYFEIWASSQESLVLSHENNKGAGQTAQVRGVQYSNGYHAKSSISYVDPISEQACFLKPRIKICEIGEQFVYSIALNP